MLDDYTPHQQKIIKRYYQNQDALALQRLGELVADLYLAEGKKRERLWKSVETALRKLEVPESRITHVLEKNDPALLAKLVEELNRT